VAVRAFSKKVLYFHNAGRVLYNKACRLVDNNKLIEGLEYFRKAVKLEPENIEYMLALAETYTDMSCFEESNAVLDTIMEAGEEMADCVYLMGCNYLGMHDYYKAKDSFSLYLDIEPDGEYADQALEIVEIMRDNNLTERHPRAVVDAAIKGKESLDKGEFKKAISLYEKLLSEYPYADFVKNNMALAYYCDEQPDKAISVCRSVLESRPENIHANCNLAIFLSGVDEKAEAKKVIQKVLSMDVSEPEDINKVALTLCELNMHEEALVYLRRVLAYRPYDKKLLHYKAIALYNCGEFQEAADCWRKISRIDPDNKVPAYYLNLILLKRQLKHRQDR
jgi:tetratricopeptide (TPR) repeat protein